MEQQSEADSAVLSQCGSIPQYCSALARTPSRSECYDKPIECSGRLIARFACAHDAADIIRLIGECLRERVFSCDAGHNSAAGTHTAPSGGECCERKCIRDFFASYGFPYPADDSTAVEDLIYESFQSIVVEDRSGIIVGFAALGHSPKITEAEASDSTDALSLYLFNWPARLSHMGYSRRGKDQGTTGAHAGSVPARPTNVSTTRSTVDACINEIVCLPADRSETKTDVSADSVNTSNTLWLNFLVCKEADKATFQCIIEAIFASAFEVHHILMFKRSELTLLCSPSPFKLLEPLENLPVHNPCTTFPDKRELPPIYHCRRTAWESPLQVRVAEVEDYDDVVRIFDEQTELSSKDYGEFFLAELIGGQDEGNKCLIAEADGTAVGLAGFTTDVDINLLYNCFHIEKHSFFIKPDYLERIQTTRKLLTHRRHLSPSTPSFPGEEHSATCSAVGDRLQAIFANIPGGIERVLASVPLNEEGLMPVPGMIHALKKAIQVMPGAAQLADIKDSIILIIWQVHFTLANVRSSGALPTALATSALQLFAGVDCMQRQQLATFLLEKWDALLSIFSAPAQIAGAPQRDQIFAQRHTRMSTSVSQHLSSVSYGGRRRTLWSSVDKRRSARLDSLFSEGDHDEGDATVKVDHLCETLLRRPEFQLQQSEVSKLLLCLHWWADVPITHPTMEISSEKLKNALQRLSRAAIEYFARMYDTPGWLQKLPTEQKNAFAVNIFAVDEQLHSQALRLLLPAFSLFEDKEYCLLLQPPTAPLLPFMRYFCAEETKLGSLVNQVLLVLHRQSLLTAPVFRPLRFSEVEEAAAKARAAGVRLSPSAIAHSRMIHEESRCQSRADFLEVEPSASSINSGEDVQSPKTDSALGIARLSFVDCSKDHRNPAPATHFAVVGHACGQIVAVAEVQLMTGQHLREIMLRSDLEPYLLHEQRRTQRNVRDLLNQRRRQRETRRKLRRLVTTPPNEVEADEQLDEKLYFDAYGGHAILHFCLIDPVFQYYELTLLREVMRLAQAKLLHVFIGHPTLPPVAFRVFSPVKPKALRDVADAEESRNGNAYPALRDHIQRTTSRANQDAAVEKSSTTPQALAHFVCKPQFLTTYTFFFHERVVVVGFSSTAYAFLKTLLFANREPRPYEHLLLSHTSFDLDEAAEVRRLLLRWRVRVIDRRLCGIDRKRKLVYLDSGPPPPYEQKWNLHNSTLTENTGADAWQGENVSEDPPIVAYDYLFLLTGLQDASLQEIGIRSWGLSQPTLRGTTKAGAAPDSGLNGTTQGCVNQAPHSLTRVNGCISSADPRLYDLFDENGPYLVPLRWNPLTQVVVYGRSIDAYCLIHGLLQRKIPPQKITLVLPPRLLQRITQMRLSQGHTYVALSPHAASHLNNTDDASVLEFEEREPMELKCHAVLEAIGVTLLEGYCLRGVLKDKKGILKFVLLCDSSKAVVFKEEEGSPQARRSISEQLLDDWSLETGTCNSAKLKPYILAPAVPSACGSVVSRDSQMGKLHSLPCRVLLTADKGKEPDHDVFRAIHDCGLVYDGRLIVNRDFQTNDAHIYGAGPLCEFSRQYRPTRQTLLSQQNYNGNEVGVYLGASFLKRLSGGFLCPDSQRDSRERILDTRLLRPQKEGGNPFAAAADVFSMPSPADLRSYLHGGDHSTANRIELLPRFSFPLCAQGILPGGLHFHRLALCAGCLSKYTCWPRERMDMRSYDRLPSSEEQWSAATVSCDKKTDHNSFTWKNNPQVSRPQEEALFTDTLQLRWSDAVVSNNGDNRQWRHLITTSGRMCEVGVDKLRRVTLFEYLGPVCLRLDAFFHLMGLPVSFLNMIEKKSRGKVVPDIMAFLSEEQWWFEALYHPRMPDFLKNQCKRLLQSHTLSHNVEEALQNRDLHNVGDGGKMAEEEFHGRANTSFPNGASFSVQKQAKQLCLTEPFLDMFHSSVADTLKKHVQAELVDLLKKYHSELPFFYLPDASGRQSEALDCKTDFTRERASNGGTAEVGCNNAQLTQNPKM